MRRAGDVSGTHLYYRVIRRCSRQDISGNVWPCQNRVSHFVTNARLVPVAAAGPDLIDEGWMLVATDGRIQSVDGAALRRDLCTRGGGYNSCGGRKSLAAGVAAPAAGEVARGGSCSHCGGGNSLAAGATTPAAGT